MGFLWVSFVGLLWFDELVIVVFLGVVWVHLCWVDFCWFCWVALLVGFCRFDLPCLHFIAVCLWVCICFFSLLGLLVVTLCCVILLVCL